jgi:hypothetical protein
MAKKAKSRSARQLAEPFIFNPRVVWEPQPSPWIAFKPQPFPWRAFDPVPVPWLAVAPEPSPWVTQLGPGAVRELRRIQTQHHKDVLALQSKTLDRATKVIKKAGR